MRRHFALAFLLFVGSVPATAQVVTPLDPSETYIPVIQTGAGSVCFPDGFCIAEAKGIPLTTFATNAQLNAVSLRIDQLNGVLSTLAGQLSGFGTQLAAFSTQLGTELGVINGRLLSIDTHLASIDSQLSDAFELVAVSAALKDAVPNDGDRFAVRLNAAGFSGEFAGAVGVSANFGARTRVLVNYGRGRSRSTVSGGVNLSFR